AALLLLRFAAGAAGAGVLVAGTILVDRLGAGDSPGRAALLLGVYFAGGGLGIVVTGLAVPSLLAGTGGAGAWQWGWVLLGGLAVIALAVSAPAVRAAPEPPPAPPGSRRWPMRSMAWLLVAYWCFGAGYIAYITFIIAFLKAKGGAGTAEITAFWVIIGVAVIAAGFAWGPVLARFRGGRGAALVLAMVAAGALVPLLSASPPAAYVSAVIFGGSFLSLVTAVMATVRRYLHPHFWTSAIATLTVTFALGQCLGPVLAGVLSDTATGLRAGLILSVALLGAGSVVALAQPKPDPRLAGAIEG
ncbi:MAG: YbfB/YjiJ family MFS transporter, partial [Acidimicrobiales bacterium]